MCQTSSKTKNCQKLLNPSHIFCDLGKKIAFLVRLQSPTRDSYIYTFSSSSDFVSFDGVTYLKKIMLL